MMSGEDKQEELDEDFKRSLVLFEEFVDAGTSLFLDVDDCEALITYYIRELKYEMALKAVDFSLHLYPDIEEFRILKAVVYSQTGRLDDGWQLLERVKDKSTLYFRLTYASFHYYGGDNESAIRILDRITEEELKEQDEELVVDVIDLYADMKQNKKVLEWLAKCGEWHTFTNSYLEMLVQACTEDGDYEEAYGVSNMLLDREPYSLAYWEMAALSLFRLGRYEEVLDACDFALVCEDKITVHFFKAYTLYQLGNYEKAIEILKICRERDSVGNDCYIPYLSLCYIGLENFDKAASCFRKAVLAPDQSSPAAKELLVEAVRGLILARRKSDAYVACGLLQKKFRGDAESELACGMYYLATGKRRKAMKYLKKAISIFPENMMYLRIVRACVECEEPKLAKYYLDLMEAYGRDVQYPELNRRL